MKTSKQRVMHILEALQKEYPDATCALHHQNPLQLLIATILSAQCTDARVNMVTPALFSRYPTVQAFASASPSDLEDIIRSTGFFRNKTKSLQGAAAMMIEKFGGQVPDTMEELVQLPGVARKTANVVLGVIFGKAEGVVVDTHVFRVARRLDLSHAPTPEKMERDLMELIPRDKWIVFSHQMIHHGRKLCKARKPLCYLCPVEKVCQSEDKVLAAPMYHAGRSTSGRKAVG